jgi:hypothetical protein
MKKMLLFAMLTLGVCAMAVDKPAKIAFASADKVVWAGVDYSQPRLIRPGEFANPEGIFPGMLEAWNNLVLQEWLKVLEKERRKPVVIDIAGVTEINKRASTSWIINSDITPDAIAKAVRSYKLENTSGVAVVFIVDRLIKRGRNSEGVMWVVAFDIGSREVLSSARIAGKAAGSDFHNYWFGIIKDAEKVLGKTSIPHQTPKTREAWYQVKSDVESKSNFSSVVFNSIPKGATVSIADVLVGTTPVSTDLRDRANIEERVFETYLEKIQTNMLFGGGILKYCEFSELVLSNTPTGQLREVVKPDDRNVEFHFEDLVGEKTLHLPDDNKVEFNFGEVRKAKSVKCQLQLGVVDAGIGVVESKDAAVEQVGGSLFVSLNGLEQDGIGRWWFNGQQLENGKLSIKLVRIAGQWIPPAEPVVVNLPKKYTAGPVDVAMDVPLKTVPWFWTHYTNWPAIDGTVMTEEQRESLKSSLNDTWSGRGTNGINPCTAVFSGLMLRALSETNDSMRLEEELREFIGGIANHKINIAFRDFHKVDPATDTAISFEIQEDTLQGLRDAGSRYFLLTDAARYDQTNSASQGGMNPVVEMPDYLMLVDLVGIEGDTQERVARESGKVKIGTSKHSNPEYYDLLKARIASQQILANIAAGSIEANSQAEKNQGDALTRILIGGALANKNLLTPTDSAGILGSALNSLFGSNAEQNKSEAYQAQLAQAQSAVNDLSQKLSSMNEYTEEPIYHDFRTEDRYVTKKALATAYVKVVDPNVPDNVFFSRKIVSDVTVADTFEEANADTGKKGHALDLPSDQQMKRDVSAKLTKELTQQIEEGFLFRLGLEYYANAKFAEANGDAEKFAVNAIRFLLSPAAKAYPNQAHDISLLLDGLVQRATRNAQIVNFADFHS